MPIANRTRFVPARVRHSPTQPIGRKRGGHQLQPREQWLLVAHIPAIVTHVVFEQVQQKLAQNRQFARRNNDRHAYLLRALVSCGVCNLSCTGRHNHANPNYAYYVCRGKSNSIHACRDHKCTARMIPANQLDDVVWQDVCEVLTHPEMLQQALERAHGGHWLPHELQARRDTLRKARATLAAQLERLTDAYLSAIIGLAEYERRRVELQRKLDALDQQDSQLDQHTQRHTQSAALATSMTEFCQRVQSSLASATFEHKRQLVELLIDRVDRVVVTNDQVEIRYVIPTSPKGELTRFCHLRLDYLNVPAPAVDLSDVRG